MLVTILIFLIILGLLVFVHEAGHFIVAKKSGMKVEEFGFGFPPRLFGLQKINGQWKIIWGHKSPVDREQTVYSINAIPLGGFVKIVGENNEHEEDPRSFINRSFTSRFLTLIAGVSMNVILAWVLISLGFISGMPSTVGTADNLPNHARIKDPEIAIMEIVKDFPADKAGLVSGDIIAAINGQTFTKAEEVKNYIRQNAGAELTFKVKRGNAELEKSLKSIAQPAPGQGPTGIVLADTGKLSFPWYLAFYEGGKATIMELGAIAQGIYKVFAQGFSLQNLGGPVQIAKITGQVTEMGFIYLVQFTSFLSLNLAILNILPFPALDGGRVLFLVIEKIRRKKNNRKVEQWANSIGFALLILLMLAVTVKDIINK